MKNHQPIVFKSAPLCEECKERPATAFSHRLPDRDGGQGAGWRFTCDCTDDREDYAVQFIQRDGCGFFQSHEQTVDWLAHLSEKTWMDWMDFGEMMTRLRSAVSVRRAPLGNL